MKEFCEQLLKIGLEYGEVVKVPDFESVRAGIPIAPGESQPDEYYIPRELMREGITFTVKVIGRSMIDYDIHEGDRLIVQATDKPESGDIVIASINGEFTVKTFFEDEDGNLWLIPGNPEFLPIQLKESDDNRIVGVVNEIIHERPRVSYRDCALAMKKYKKEQKKKITNVDITRALSAAVEEMNSRRCNSSRMWFAVYRAFVDREVIVNGDYAGFVDILQEMMGEAAPELNIKDMRSCVDVLSFAKPIALWSNDNAPVTGTRFFNYLAVAKATLKALFGE